MTEDYTLSAGTHASPADGRCAMEWVSHLAGERHSDAPACVSPVLRAICVTLNDGLADGPRQRLRPALARTIGTAGDGLDAARAWSALDWLARTWAPAWLALAGLTDEAQRLRSGPAVLDPSALRATMAHLRGARQAARSARVAAFGARSLRLGARLTSASAARAGREAAWPCAGAAAWAAARVAVDDDAADGLRTAVRGIAGDAAAIAMLRVCADEVCGTPSGRGALATAIAPAQGTLERSAIELLTRMLPGELVTVATGDTPLATARPALAAAAR